MVAGDDDAMSAAERRFPGAGVAANSAEQRFPIVESPGNQHQHHP